MEDKIRFGTDGIRGKADRFPFTQKGLINLGSAISKWSLQKYKTNPKLLIASDTRISCEKIRTYLKLSFSKFNIEYEDAGVLPTPAVLQLIQNDPSFNFGIVISASHNPYTDNGIKIFEGSSGKLSLQDEKIITDLFAQLTNNHYSKNIEENVPKHINKSLKNHYVKNIISHFSSNLLTGIKISLDCANGSTYDVAPEIFRKLGAEITVLSNKPDGENINNGCGALHPENLQKMVLATKANFGFAFDGDGDRVIAVNKEGELRNGDDVLAALAQHPQMENTKYIVGTIMTNHGFAKYLEQQDKTLIRTPVGDKYISAKLEEEKLVLGGEASGHIIVKNYLNTGDGIFAALKTIESLKETNNMEFNSFEKFPQILLNLPVSKKDDLSKPRYAKLIESKQKELVNGRIIVRFSGTENVLRVMTEDQNEELANRVAQTLATKLQEALM